MVIPHEAIEKAITSSAGLEIFAAEHNSFVDEERGSFEQNSAQRLQIFWDLGLQSPWEIRGVDFFHLMTTVVMNSISKSVLSEALSYQIL